jgi:hypothetical protein
MQDFDCGQMCESGCNRHYEFVLGAGAKAKSVTNNLPIVRVGTSNILSNLKIFLLKFLLK